MCQHSTSSRHIFSHLERLTRGGVALLYGLQITSKKFMAHIEEAIYLSRMSSRDPQRLSPDDAEAASS